MVAIPLEFRIMKIHRLPEGKMIKAFVDLAINNVLLIRGLRVVEGKNGLFVSMPREKSKNDVWYDRIRCLSPDVEQVLNKTVIEAYQMSNN